MVFKNKLKDLLSLGTINISSSIIFGIFWLYLASIMTKEEYGELGFFISIANVGAAVSLFGFRTMVVVYESKNENVFPASFIFVLISANITALVTFVLIQNVYVSILIVGMVIFQIILSGLNSKQRYTDFAKHKIIRAIITVGVALVLFQIFGIYGILLGYFLSTLFILKDLNFLINESDHKPVFLFKHSTRCPISSAADQEYREFIGQNETEKTVTFAHLDLIQHRDVSNAIAEFGGDTL